MSDFKVGDRVRVIGASYFKGETGPVLDNNYRNSEVLKYLVHTNNGSIPFAAHELELEEAYPSLDSQIEALESRVQALEKLLGEQRGIEYPIGTVVRLLNDSTTTFEKTGVDEWTATFEQYVGSPWKKTEEYILDRGIAEVIK